MVFGVRQPADPPTNPSRSHSKNSEPEIIFSDTLANKAITVADNRQRPIYVALMKIFFKLPSLVSEVANAARWAVRRC